MLEKDGLVFPKCGCRRGYRLSNGRCQCAQCRHQTSVTAGTVLYGSHIKLTKWFLALSLDGRGHPLYLKMQVTDNLKQDSVKRFVGSTCVSDSTIRSDGYSSYIPALTDFTHEYSSYNSDSGLLRWLHIILGNAKVFVLGTYHGLPKTCLQSYLDEFCFRFFRRFFGADLFLHLVLAISLSSQADSKG